MATLQEIANICGVSKSTVSRILNNKNFPVSEATRQKVLMVAKDMSGVTLQKDCVAFVFHDDYSRMYIANLINSLEKRLNDHNIDMVIMRTNQDIKKIPAIANGVIVFGNPNYAHENIDFFNKNNISLLNVYGGIDNPDNKFICDRIDVQYKQTTENAIIHLVNQNCKNISFAHFLSCESWDKWKDTRHVSYYDIMNKLGLEPNCILCRGFNHSDFRESIKQYLNEHSLPDAIICMNEDIAIGFRTGLEDLGYSVPDDVALVGYEGMMESDFYKMPLSNIAMPIEQLSILAADFMVNRLHDPSYPLQNIVLQSEFVPSQSSIRNKNDVRYKMLN